jgi:putative membrane protein
MAASIAVSAVAILHLTFLVLEMFLWTKPAGRRIFGLSKEFARQSATLAANQGLYNGFIAAGLLWSQFAKQPLPDLTVRHTILFVQAVPGAIALIIVLTSG